MAPARLLLLLLVFARAAATRISRRGLVATTVLGGGAVVSKQLIDGPDVLRLPKDSLRDRVVLITGANTGLGKESALRLAEAGATVILASRDKLRGEAAAREVRDATGNEKVNVIQLDLGDLASVDRAAREVAATYDHIDVLLNNAGVMAIPEFTTTREGIERQFGVNHIGHFALTAKLMKLLARSKGGRVVNVSSDAHLFAREEDMKPPYSEPATYTQWGAYSRSKLANVLFTKELNTRFANAGLQLTAVALHPGVVRTDLGRYLIGAGPDPPSLKGPPNALNPITWLLTYLSRPIDRGANTQVYLAAGLDGGYGANGGGYFSDMHLSKGNPLARRADLAADLWQQSERLAGLKFPL